MVTKSFRRSGQFAGSPGLAHAQRDISIPKDDRQHCHHDACRADASFRFGCTFRRCGCVASKCVMKTARNMLAGKIPEKNHIFLCSARQCKHSRRIAIIRIRRRASRLHFNACRYRKATIHRCVACISRQRPAIGQAKPSALHMRQRPATPLCRPSDGR